MTRTELFEAIRPAAPQRRFNPSHVKIIDDLADLFGLPRLDGDLFTARAAMELISHEAIVLEAYKDSVGVWTWGIGLTAASGVDPLAFKDKPADMAQVLKAFVTATRRRYVPAVKNAFAGCDLTESQFAAALSFHYNTGAIERTDWVNLWKADKADEARAFLETHYLNGGTLTERRKKEAALFFDNEWSAKNAALVVPVAKPSYLPAFARARYVDISAALKEAML